MKKDQPYQKLDIIDIENVPDWDRRPDKWGQLVRDVLSLEPGKSLPVLFDSRKQAHHARNAVRYRANTQLGKAEIRTRLVQRKDGKYELHLIRLPYAEGTDEE